MQKEHCCVRCHAWRRRLVTVRHHLEFDVAVWAAQCVENHTLGGQRHYTTVTEGESCLQVDGRVRYVALPR